MWKIIIGIILMFIGSKIIGFGGIAMFVEGIVLINFGIMKFNTFKSIAHV